MAPTKTERSTALPLELTAPQIQRIARKGVDEQLSAEECAEICACVVFHIDTALAERRIPRALKAARRA